MVFPFRAGGAMLNSRVFYHLSSGLARNPLSYAEEKQSGLFRRKKHREEYHLCFFFP